MLIALKKLLARLSRGRWFPDFHPRWSDLAEKDQLAARGEELALRTLVKSGYRIMAQRWRWHRFELDLVARKGNTVAVIEVKTRRDDRFGSPQEAVPRWKQRRIITAAKAFVRHKRLEDYILRFDIVAITIPPGGKPEILHIDNAFSS